jgi:phosphatidylglycerol:prolipoprotein diacylglycerol transferase
LTVYTYGFFVATGFIAGMLLAVNEAKRLGEDREKIVDLCFYLLVAAIIGSRLFYIAINLKLFVENPVDIFKIWEGGLVFYGGFIAALFTAILYLKKRKMFLWKTADILAPSIAAGHFFGRIGCFFAGCCYGKACDLPWAVTFTHPDTLAFAGIPLHPTQLYHAAGNLAIFCFLWFFRRRRQFDGQLFWLYVLLYGTTRSLLEIFRGDDRGEALLGLLSISQVTGGAMALVAIAMILFLGKRKGKTRIDSL